MGYALAVPFFLLAVFCGYETFTRALDAGLCDTGAPSCENTRAGLFMALTIVFFSAALISVMIEWRARRKRGKPPWR